jgi:hypothetical protein
MDDLVYAEPQAIIPEPSSMLLLGTGLLALWVWHSFKKNRPASA